MVEEVESPARKARLDPIAPGVSIGRVGSVPPRAGTIGCIVFDKVDGTPYVLCDWHVLQGGDGVIGNAVFQPGPHDDNRTRRNRLGVLSRCSPAGTCPVGPESRAGPRPRDSGVAYAVRPSGRVPGRTRCCCGTARIPASWKGLPSSQDRTVDAMPATDETREELKQQAAAAAQRYRNASAERQAIEAQLARGVKYPDLPEAIAARAGRLLDRGGVPPSAAVANIRAEALDESDAFERIIDFSNELQSWSFLPRGARAAATVARISLLRNGLEQRHGTGFLVSPQLLLTNHHVLPDGEFARNCFLEFNAQVTVDNAPDAAVRFELAPGTFFVADKHLDFALVAVAPTTDGRLPGEIFGWNRLVIQPGKLVVNEPVNVIGHPLGRLKEITIRDNALQLRLEEFLHYRADTLPGSSGSPVFNDQWEVVALHHSGVPKTDAQGNELRKDGQIWRPGDGDDAKDYVSNEGIRTSVILKHLAALPLDPARRVLLAGMGPESGQQGTFVPGPQEIPGPQATPGPQAPSGPQVASGPPVASAAFSGTTREATDSRSGLRAASTAFGGKRHLVFLHGRRQEGLDPEVLRRGWTGGLNHGLTRAGIASLDPADIWFPYYGDCLIAAVGQHEAVPRSFEEVTAVSAAEAFTAQSPTGSYEQLVVEAAVRRGMPQDGQAATERLGSTLVGTFQRALTWLADTTDVDALVIASIFRDVDAYLGNPGVREKVLDCVFETMPTDGTLVLVTHSLGTVVGMDLITNRLPDAMRVDLLVTAGSPLGMDDVHRRLLPPGPNRPEKVRNWVNAWCPTDAVAIGCPLDGLWGDLTNLAVKNASDRAHSIEEYLAHPEVATKIGQALST